jgi:hypothetical protein
MNVVPSIPPAPWVAVAPQRARVPPIDYADGRRRA